MVAMGRRSKTQTLGVWMNGEFVGHWTVNSRGEHEFAYDPAWVASDYGRSISLSMPLQSHRSFKGQVVKNYFDNLLPDNEQIRTRIQQRFGAQSVAPFDLLTEVGRDCAGALQLLPDGETSGNIRCIEVEPMSETEIERILVSTPVFGRHQDDGDFRISIAGAQEKTALTFHAGRWMRPRGTTPTTHILKLPIGQHKNQGIDLTTSVENEWLCAQILNAYGGETSKCWPETFGKQTVLVVERFDRRLSPDGKWLMRLPQEDMCQAMGVSPAMKYEKDGGPGIKEIMNLLLGSSKPESDRLGFFKTQVIFWMLCAIDGHAKNFSIFLEPKGGYRLTPGYDVLSAYPVLGDGPHTLQEKKIKMAMALMGKNRHYRWSELQLRHLLSTAKVCGMEASGRVIIEELISITPNVIAQVASTLPANFPGHVSQPILLGLTKSVHRLEAELVNLLPNVH